MKSQIVGILQTESKINFKNDISVVIYYVKFY